MADIQIPKLNNNDQTYLLVEWIVADDEPVKAGDAIATIETSKAAEELVSEEAGVLWHALAAGAECQPGDVIAQVVAPGTERTADASPASAKPAAAAGGNSDGHGDEADDKLVITQAAQALADKLSVGQDQLRELDAKVIRAADVEQLAAESAGQDEPSAAETVSPDRIYQVPTVQRAVSRTVQRSHQSIPAAYTVVKVDVGAAQATARQLGKQLRKLVGLPELLIAAVAGLYQEYPLFFAAPRDDDTMILADGAHVGLTIDADNGLFVPVVRNASALTMEEIAAAVGEFRLSASRGKFREQDLSGGNISIALHRDPAVVIAIPLIFPGQTSCLALAGAQAEAVVDDEGHVTARTVSNIGLAYDHRYINGAQALQFLQAVKEALEAPDRLLGTAD